MKGIDLLRFHRRVYTPLEKLRQRLNLHRKYGRKVTNNGSPIISSIGRSVDLPTAGAEIHAALVQRIDGHGVAQHVHVAVALRQTFGERLPLVSSCAAAEHAQLPIGNKVFRVALDGHDVNRLRLVRVNVDHETEIGGKVPADLLPGIAGVIAPHHIPVLLHKKYARTRRVHGDVVNTVPDLSGRVRNVLGIQTAVDRLPAFATVVGTKCSRCRNRNVDALRIAGIENDRVQTHTTGARLPLWAGAMAAQPGEFRPVLSAIRRAEQGGVFDASVNRIGVLERWFQMPDALELPRMLRPVIPLMSGERLAAFIRRVVDELVACWLRRTRGGRFTRGCSRLMPCFAPVIGALNDLPKPAAGLRRIQPVRIRGRSLHVIHFPASKMRTADIPFIALVVSGATERTLACPYQNSYAAHSFFLLHSTAQ